MLRVFADENIPGLEACLAPGTPLARGPGRSLARGDLEKADVLLVRSVTRVDAALLEGTPIRFVGTATSGLDHIDRTYLHERGIAFAHAPGANANSVVEYLLSAIASVGDVLERILHGGRVGIVGYGHIGRAVQRRLEALGVECRVYDPWLEQDAVPGAVALPEDLLDCEVITLHPELTDEAPYPSRHVFGRELLDRLGPQHLLVNASRGPVVDNDALRIRLARPDAPVAVLDVWEREPDLDTHLLAAARIGTAHIAGYSHPGKLLATNMLCAAAAEAVGLELGTGDTGNSGTVISLAPGLGGADLVRTLLRTRYDIRADDARLRAAIDGADGGDVGAAFDHLRRNYPRRDELAGCHVRCSAAQAALVAALGCEARVGEGNDG